MPILRETESVPVCSIDLRKPGELILLHRIAPGRPIMIKLPNCWAELWRRKVVDVSHGEAHRFRRGLDLPIPKARRVFIVFEFVLLPKAERGARKCFAIARRNKPRCAYRLTNVPRHAIWSRKFGKPRGDKCKLIGPIFIIATAPLKLSLGKVQEF